MRQRPLRFLKRWAASLHAMGEAYGLPPHALLLEFRGHEYDKKRFDFAVMLYASAQRAYEQHVARQ